MREYKLEDGGKIIVGSFAEISQRVALRPERPLAKVGFFPVFKVDQFPQVLQSLPASYLADKIIDGDGRATAQHLADQRLQGNFGKVSLLKDEPVAELHENAAGDIIGIRILFGTELIPADERQLVKFAGAISTHVLQGGPELGEQLPYLERLLWQQQSARYGALAFGPFCGTCEWQSAAENLSNSGPFGIWCASPPPAGVQPAAADQSSGLDHRQFQN